jgi:hypothetical protein
MTRESKVEPLIFLPPDHCLIGKATAHQMRVSGSSVRRRADLSRVLAILVFIDSEAELLLSSTSISSKLCAKWEGA